MEFDIGKTVFESLTGEINATNIKKIEKIYVLKYISLCLASEFLARSEDFIQIFSRRRASRFNDKIA